MMDNDTQGRVENARGSNYLRVEFPYEPLSREDEQRIGREMIVAREEFMFEALRNPYVAGAVAFELNKKMEDRGSGHSKYLFNSDKENAEKKEVIRSLSERVRMSANCVRALEEDYDVLSKDEREKRKAEFSKLQKEIVDLFKKADFYSGMLAARIAKYCSDKELSCVFVDESALESNSYKIYQEARSRLYCSIARLGRYHARSYARWLGSSDAEELFDIADEGCLEAIDTWDPERNNKISTHAIWRIKQRLGRDGKRHFAKLSESPRLIELIRIAKREEHAFEVETGREPNLEEFAGLLGVDVNLAMNVRKFMRTKSLDDIVGEDGSLGALVGKEDVQLCAFEEDFDSGVFWRGVKSVVSPKEYRILRRLFVENKTLDEVGTEFGLTRERIRQYKVVALRRLKDAFPNGIVAKKIKVESEYDGRRRALPFVREYLANEFGADSKVSAEYVMRQVLALSSADECIDTRVVRGRRKKYVKNESRLLGAIRKVIREIGIESKDDGLNAKVKSASDETNRDYLESRESFLAFLRRIIETKSGLTGVSLEKRAVHVKYRLLKDDSARDVLKIKSSSGNRFEYFVGDEAALEKRVCSLLNEEKEALSDASAPREISYPKVRQFIRAIVEELGVNEKHRDFTSDFVAERVLQICSGEAVLKWKAGEKEEYYVKNPKLVRENVEQILRRVLLEDTDLKPAS